MFLILILIVVLLFLVNYVYNVYFHIKRVITAGHIVDHFVGEYGLDVDKSAAIIKLLNSRNFINTIRNLEINDPDELGFIDIGIYDVLEEEFDNVYR